MMLDDPPDGATIRGPNVMMVRLRTTSTTSVIPKANGVGEAEEEEENT